MTRTTATVLGFVLAPILPGVIFLIGSPLLREGADFTSLLQATLLSYFFSAGFTIFIGIPMFVLLWKLDLINWWSVLTAGFVIGGLVAVILQLPGLHGIEDIPAMGLVGSSTTFLFWLIRRLGRPENNNSGQTQ